MKKIMNQFQITVYEDYSIDVKPIVAHCSDVETDFYGKKIPISGRIRQVGTVIEQVCNQLEGKVMSEVGVLTLKKMVSSAIKATAAIYEVSIPTINDKITRKCKEVITIDQFVQLLYDFLIVCENIEEWDDMAFEKEIRSYKFWEVVLSNATETEQRWIFEKIKTKS